MNSRQKKPEAHPVSANECVLAFDYGLKNIGVAVGQSKMQSASDLPALKAKDGIPNWDAIKQLLSEWHIDYVVVGLPLNMDGSESEMCARARKFANRITGRFNVQTELADERLSSNEAKAIAEELGHHGHYGSKPIDSIAATLILESWWRQLADP